MVVGEIATGTDLLVIGAGPGGYSAAIRAAREGLDVMLVEKETVGGTCLNRGCIPAKALIEAGHASNTSRDWDGILEGELEVDLEKLQEWKKDTVDRLDSGILEIMDRVGVEYENGTARFIDSNSVRLEKEHDAEKIEFENAVIATGSTPVELPGLEFDRERVISSRELLNLEEIPEELVIVGGGYIGMEAATKFSDLGSEVKIVEARDRILEGFPDEVAETLKRNDKYSENLHENAEAVEARTEGDKAVLEVEKDGESKEIEGDYILVAAGRTAESNLEDLGLENTDVKVEDGFIRTDREMKTSDESIFAIGDAAGEPMLAHKAYREGKVAAEVAAGKPAKFDNQAIPKVMFTDPEVATVGLSEKEARQEHELKTGRFPMSASGRSLTTRNDEGFVKVVASEDEQLLGVIIVSARASDMIAEATLALEMQAYLDDLTNTIHAHPTFPEALSEAAEDARNESVHTF